MVLARRLPLAAAAPHLLSRVRWLDRLPEIVSQMMKPVEKIDSIRIHHARPIIADGRVRGVLLMLLRYLCPLAIIGVLVSAL